MENGKKQKKTKKQTKIIIKKTTILFEYYLIADKDTTKDVELVGFLKDNLCTLQMPQLRIT